MSQILKYFANLDSVPGNETKFKFPPSLAPLFLLMPAPLMPAGRKATFSLAPSLPRSLAPSLPRSLAPSLPRSLAPSLPAPSLFPLTVALLCLQRRLLPKQVSLGVLLRRPRLLQRVALPERVRLLTPDPAARPPPGRVVVHRVVVPKDVRLHAVGACCRPGRRDRPEDVAAASAGRTQHPGDGRQAGGVTSWSLNSHYNPRLAKYACSYTMISATIYDFSNFKNVPEYLWCQWNKSYSNSRPY